MAVVMIMEWAGVTPEHYEEARRQVDWEGDEPEGGIVHIAWFAEGSLHVVDLWESPEQFQRFATERLTPVTSAMGVPGEPKVQFHPAHAVFNPGLDRATVPA